MVKTITIDGRELTLKATGMTPIIYSNEYPGEDMIVEMQRLMSANKNNDVIPPGLLEVLAKIAFVMARAGDPEMEAKTWEEFLDGFDLLPIYELLPAVVELWGMNTTSTSTRKKVSGQ
jgi:hypothetical protein